MGIEKVRYEALRQLLTGERVDASGIYPWDEGGRGSDNQAALALAAGYLAGVPGARQASWSWYAGQLEGRGLMGNEPLSRPYHHYHWAAAQATRWHAHHSGDAPMVLLLDLWSSLLMSAYAILARWSGASVESEAPCARASWSRSVHADLALQSALHLPLSRRSGPYVDWRNPSSRALGLGLQEGLEQDGAGIFGQPERDAWHSWIRRRSGEPPTLRIPLASPLVVEVRGVDLVAYFPELSSYDDPQPGLIIAGGEVRYLRPAEGGHVYPRGPVTTTIEGDQLVCQAPIGNGVTWRAEQGLPTSPITRAFRLEGTYAFGQVPQVPPAPVTPPPGLGPQGSAAYALRRAADLVDGGDLAAAATAYRRAARLEPRLGS